MAKRKIRRSGPLQNRTPARPQGPPATPVAADVRQAALPALAVLGLLVYLALFLLSPLPSLPADPRTGDHFRRLDLLPRLLLLDEIVGNWFGSPFEFAPFDRLPVLALAAGTLGVAGVAGWLALRLLGAGRGLTPVEQGVFACGMGLSLVSLYVLAVGLCGWLRQPLVFVLPAAGVLAAAAFVWWRNRTRPENPDASASHDLKSDIDGEQGLSLRWLWLAAPFALLILLGGLLPPVEFDVREYHLQAPKEFWQAGRISFLPHNVYANMNLGAELLSIPAMSVSGDWWLGALAGKTLIALFGPLTALGLFCAGRRFFSRTVGIVAAVVFLATPWIVSVSTDGLVEGAGAFYLLLTIYAVSLWRAGGDRHARQDPADRRANVIPRDAALDRSRLLLAGFLAGSAVAVKYPAVLFVLLPIGAWVLAAGGTGAARWKALCVFTLAALLACGLWFGKNWALTDNPTYPLLYNVFGGQTRTEDKNAQWERVHSPRSFTLGDLASDVRLVAWRSEWLGPVALPLALVALSIRSERRRVGTLWAYLGFTLIAWWLWTHRIDRFWVPALAVLSLLAGVGARQLAALVGRRALVAALTVGCLWGLIAATSGAIRVQQFFVSLARLRVDPDRVINPIHLWLNENVPPGEGVLLVGDAQPFDLSVPTLYATCFDDCPLELIVRDRTPAEIRDELSRQRIRYLYVRWPEVDRYRSPGNYGFTDFIQPALFDQLVTDKVLERPDPITWIHYGELYRVPD